MFLVKIKLNKYKNNPKMLEEKMIHNTQNEGEENQKTPLLF